MNQSGHDAVVIRLLKRTKMANYNSITMSDAICRDFINEAAETSLMREKHVGMDG